MCPDDAAGETGGESANDSGSGGRGRPPNGRGDGGQPDGTQPLDGRGQGGQPSGQQPPRNGRDQTGRQGPPNGGEPQGGRGQPAGGQSRQGDRGQGGQPGGQQARSAQQPAPGQPRGGHRTGAGSPQPGVGDLVGRPAVKGRIVETVGFYAVVGLGVGLAALAAKLFAGGGVRGAVLGAMFAVAGLLVVIAIGPILAGVVSVRTTDRLDGQGDKAVMVTNFLGNAGGYLVMVVLASLFTSSVGGGSSGSTTAGTGSGGFGGSPGTSAFGGMSSVGVGDLLVPLIGVAIVVGVVGVAVTYLMRSVGFGGSGRPAPGRGVEQ